jgi:hypothetical protein
MELFMSTWTTIRDDIEAPVEKLITFVEGSSLGQQLEGDVKAALAELETISETDLKAAVTTIGVAALGGLSTGGTAGAIAAGIAAAPAAFEAAGKDISTKTTSTLVTSIVNSLSTPATVSTVSAVTAPGTTPAS